MSGLRHRRLVVLLLALGTLTAASACGVPTDAAPTPIAVDELPDSLRPTGATESTTTVPVDDANTVPVWLILPGQQDGDPTVLERVRRPVETANLRAALIQLFQPVLESEAPLTSQWANLADIELVDVTTDEATATATITLSAIPPIGEFLTQAFAQLVFTASEFTGVDVVQFQIGTDPTVVPVPVDGGVTRQQVTTADYSSLDPSVVPTTESPVIDTTPG